MLSPAAKQINGSTFEIQLVLSLKKLCIVSKIMIRMKLLAMSKTKKGTITSSQLALKYASRIKITFVHKTFSKNWPNEHSIFP